MFRYIRDPLRAELPFSGCLIRDGIRITAPVLYLLLKRPTISNGKTISLTENFYRTLIKGLMDSTAGPAAMVSSGPPYAPRTAGFGGRPDNTTDVAVSGLFVALFAILAILHMSIFRVNKLAGHFFVFNAVIFGFCMSRIVTFVMRIVWAKNPTNISVAIAANVFVSAGVVLLFVINMNFAQRIVRAYHPRFEGSKPFYYAFLGYYISLVGVLIMVITTTVQSFYTLNPSILKKDMDVRKFGVMWFLIFAFATIPITLLAIFWPSSTQPKNFGKKGSLKTKVIIVLVAGATLTLSTAVRTATTLGPQRPATNPLWYHSRAAFYVFLATLEILVVIFFAVMRVDQRFFVPGKAEMDREAEMEKASSSTSQGLENHV